MSSFFSPSLKACFSLLPGNEYRVYGIFCHLGSIQEGFLGAALRRHSPLTMTDYYEFVLLKSGFVLHWYNYYTV